MEIKPHKYRVLQDWERGEVTSGEIVYSLLACDYALARADTRDTGKEHLTVTKREDGGYSGFTIPLELLEDLEPEPKSDFKDECKSIPRHLFQKLIYFFEDLISNDPRGHWRRIDVLVWSTVLLVAYVSVTYSANQQAEDVLFNPSQVITPPVG